MPNISELKKSSFLTKNDLGPQGSIFTISGCEQINVAKEGAAPEMKWALTLLESEKPFILNSTNAQIIAKFTGSDETDNWTGKKAVLFFDPNVSFGGKLTGGIRARAPRGPGATGSRPAPVAPAPEPLAEEPGEDVPFN